MSATLASALADAAARAAGGDIDGALEAYRLALRSAPQLAEVWLNVGVLETARQAHEAALAAFERAARLRPAWAEPWHGRGRALFALHRYADASDAFARAATLDPRHVSAHVNHALALHRLQRFSEAAGPLRLARMLAPRDESIWWLLRGNLLARRRDEDALADHLAFAPEAQRSAKTVVAELASVRRLGDAARDDAALLDALDFPFQPGDSPLLGEALALLQYFDLPREGLLRMYRTYDRLVREELIRTGTSIPLARNAPRTAALDDARVRIGYLSADFRRHVMGELLAPVLAAHDRARFHVSLFSLAPRDNEDAMTQRFREWSDAFVVLDGLDDDAAAGAIAGQDLDLLVDLMGHSAFARPGVLARRPARMIVTHLGYHGALGLSSVAYKITDDVADLPENARYQLEALLPLSRCVLPGRSYVPPPARYARTEIQLPHDAIACAAFVPVRKLSPRCLALWRQVLEAVPGTLLLFSPQREDDRVALLRRVEGFGIAAERVRFVPFDVPYLHDRYGLADFALDTLPYTGGDTTLAALSAGIPVVTRCGLRHAERVGASILRHAGLDALVADDDASYVLLATRMARDAEFREQMREATRKAASAADRHDPTAYARALEGAYLSALDSQHLLPSR